MDESFGSLLQQSDFRSITTMSDYLAWVRFKMETIADFYEHYCSLPLIGRPIDAFAFSVRDYASA
jgi:hypothetical protein